LPRIQYTSGIWAKQRVAMMMRPPLRSIDALVRVIGAELALRIAAARNTPPK